MSHQQYDLAIIGGGPAGYSAALHGAKKHASVVLIEQGDIGGTCLNRGCIPSKVMLEAAVHLQSPKSYLSQVTLREQMLFQHRSATIKRLRKGIEYLLKKNKISVISGKASLKADRTVEVETVGGKEVVQAKYILLATGSVPRELPILQAHPDVVANSDYATQTEEIPESITIVGAGAVGVEFAYIYRALGSEVTLVEAAERVLPGEDADIGAAVEEKLAGLGIQVIAGKKLEAAHTGNGGITISLEGSMQVTSRKVLCSVGRKANTEGLGLEELGIALGEQSQIAVNEFMQTNLPDVYAAGDVTGRMMLAHVAISQAVAAVGHMFGESRRPWDGSAVPRCVYIAPEVACCGLTEQAARAAGETVKVQIMPFLANGKAVATGEEEGFVKVIANGENQLLGIHMFGPRATDMISQGSYYVANRLSVDEVANQMYPHPTYSETLYEAVLAIEGNAIHY